MIISPKPLRSLQFFYPGKIKGVFLPRLRAGPFTLIMAPFGHDFINKSFINVSSIPSGSWGQCSPLTAILE